MRVTAGVDLGARKVAISLFVDGELASVDSLEVLKATRSRELRTLAEWAQFKLKPAQFVMVEEPLIGRGVRASLQVAQTAGAVLSYLPYTTQSDLVSVTAWKKEICGKGNADKEFVSNWVKSSHPSYSALCGANQDRIDALCIGLYAVQLQARAGQLAVL